MSHIIQEQKRGIQSPKSVFLVHLVKGHFHEASNCLTRQENTFSIPPLLKLKQNYQGVTTAD